MNVLQNVGLNLETVSEEIERRVNLGVEKKWVGSIPYTPRVKSVIAIARREANNFGHTYVGTEHLLLGLLAEGDGVAAQVLKHFKMDTEATRKEVLKELDPNFAPDEDKQNGLE